MTIQRPEPGDLADNAPAPEDQHGSGHRHGGHRLMMIACCIPMIVVALLLVATGVAGSGILAIALLCTALMAAMMVVMPGGHGHK